MEGVLLRCIKTVPFFNCEYVIQVSNSNYFYFDIIMNKNLHKIFKFIIFEFN